MDAATLQAAVERSWPQHGILTREQALACAITRHALAHLVESGRWQRVLPQIYAVTSGELDAWAWASAASLHVGGRGALARRSAAAARGLLPWPERTQVVVQHKLHLDHPQIELHWTRDLPRTDRIGVRSVWVTSPVRTLLDLGRELDDVSLGDVFAQMLRRRMVSKPELLHRLDRERQDPYTALLRSMVAIEGKPDSGVEVVLAKALREAGLEVALNKRKGLRRPDIVLPAHRVVVQVESDGFHSGLRGPADIERDAYWLGRGFLTIRVKAGRVRRELPVVVAEILASLEGREVVA